MAIETIYRQKAPRNLTEAQNQAKLQKDSEYEIAVRNLSTPFYTKKRTGVVTPEEEQAYLREKSRLWNDYLEWAKANGFYEEVTPEQQLAEAEEGLYSQLERVNRIRAELNLNNLEVKEKAGEK